MQYQKVKSVSKTVHPKGKRLDSLVLDTVEMCSEVVGATLGPGGMSVLIERQEQGMPPMVTKDGVTVFRALGFSDATSQIIMEAVRDSAIRTASEAGDGPQPLWSKILTPNGFITMGEAEPGMVVCGTNGTIQEIVSVHPKGQKEIFNVTFDGGMVVECCSDHLWTVVNNVGSSNTLTTKEIQKGLDHKPYQSSVRPVYFTPFCTDARNPSLRTNELGNKIISIRGTGKLTEMKCIKVSNPDNLYVTDGFIVTHNTTSATILANGFVKSTMAFCKANPRVSPQRVVRSIENAFTTVIEPFIKEKSVKVNLDTGKKALHAVAKVSANGDVPLANAVMQCFDLVGDEGNVTILEYTGPSKYEVERLDGFGIPIGYEDCCGPFYQKFINDSATQSCHLENPFFVLYFGQIRDISVCANLFEKIIEAAGGKVPNIVLVATGFSETVLGHLAVNFSAANKNINVYPLLAPMSPIKTGQHDFLQDLAALSGGRIFDPIQKPLDSGHAEDLGLVSKFESSRFRSNIIIDMDEETEVRIFSRVDEINKQLSSIATAELEKQLLKERIGKLTGGIAKLKIFGSSNGELREKRDRAEDAICAVRGALKHGTLPAGGHTIVLLHRMMAAHSDVIYREVIAPAIIAPVVRLFKNAGFSEEERVLVTDAYSESSTFDLLDNKMVNPWDSGLLDSTPAVLEAIRNSISIATLMGTLGATICFGRDLELERKESIEARNYLRDVGEEPITERP